MMPVYHLCNGLPPQLVVPMRNVQVLSSSVEHASTKNEDIDSIDGLPLVLYREGLPELDSIFKKCAIGCDYLKKYGTKLLMKHQCNYRN